MLFLDFMIATFGCYWLINHLNVIKAVGSFMPIIMQTLSDSLTLSGSLRETEQILSHWLFKVKLKSSGQDHSDVHLNPALGYCVMTFHYDKNIILSWMKNLMLNAEQNFSMSIVISFCSVNEVVVSDMFSHYLAVSKRRKDFINLTQNCKETFLIPEV